MSTLKVTDIQSNGTGFNDVVSFQNASGTENGKLCRAFVNFNGTTGSGVGFSDITIRASFNVSSILDNGTGNYRVNFTTALTDANYGVVSTLGLSGNVVVMRVNASSPPTNLRCDILSNRTDTTAAVDSEYVNVAFFR